MYCFRLMATRIAHLDWMEKVMPSNDLIFVQSWRYEIQNGSLWYERKSFLTTDLSQSCLSARPRTRMYASIMCNLQEQVQIEPLCTHYSTTDRECCLPVSCATYWNRSFSIMSTNLSICAKMSTRCPEFEPASCACVGNAVLSSSASCIQHCDVTLHIPAIFPAS